MPTLDWHLTRTDGITLVELLVTSDADCEVRIESNVEPVWPPRRQGVPEAGWEDGEFVGRIEAGERLLLGYASPAGPEEPPAELRSRPAGDSPTVSARELIRVLGDPTPPRDVVPAVEEVDRDEAGPPAGRSTPPTRDPASGVPDVFESRSEDVESRVRKAERLAIRQRELAGRLDALDTPAGTVEER